jgi:hypothetical protein
MVNTIQVAVPAEIGRPAILKALKNLSSVSPYWRRDREVWMGQASEDLDTLRSRGWEIIEYKRRFADPAQMPTDEITIRDLHSICEDVLARQGAKALMRLFTTYGIVSLLDLPLPKVAEFYADAFTAYYSVITNTPGDVPAL